MSCNLGKINENCNQNAPCGHNGLCYTKEGNIPTSILTGLRDKQAMNLSDQQLLKRMAMTCSNTMYQSKDSCPTHCQWLGGKVNRCQKKRETAKPIKRKLTAQEKRSLVLAERQPESIKKPKAVKKQPAKSKKKSSPKNTFPDCYGYTDEDKEWRNSGGKTGSKWTRTEQDMCERHGHVYTKGKNESHPQCGKCWCCKGMAGGACLYNTIVNPITNRKVSINSSAGKKILTNYLHNL